MNIRLLIASIVATMSGMLLAADVTFPDADGSHDIASSNAWGLASMADLTGRAKFTGANGTTYVASTNVTLAGILTLPAKNATLTFDMRNAASGLAEGDDPRVITMTAGFANQGSGTTNNIYGGLWDFNKGSFLTGNAGGQELTTYVGYGAIITNASAFYGGAYSDGRSHMTVDGGSRIYAGHLIVGYYAGNNTSTMTIKGGSKVFLNGKQDSRSLRSDAVGKGKGNYLLITGEGSEIVATTGSGMICWGFGKGGNLWEITEGGKFSAIGSVQIGANTSSFNNTMRVATNSFFDCESTLSVGDSSGGNLFYVDGGTASPKSMIIGERGGSNIVRVANGGTLNLTSASYIKNGGGIDSSCRLEILEGGTVNLKSPLYFGPYGDGSGRLTGGTPNCQVIISNGTYNATSWPFIGFCYGSSNSEFRIVGPKAKVNITEAGNTSIFMYAPYCKFVVDGAYYTNTTSSAMNSCYSNYPQHNERVEIINGGGNLYG